MSSETDTIEIGMMVDYGDLVELSCSAGRFTLRPDSTSTGRHYGCLIEQHTAEGLVAWNPVPRRYENEVDAVNAAIRRIRKQGS